MNKTEMLAELERRLGSHGAAVSALDAVLGTVQEAVAAGDKVTLTGFGTFERVTRPARTGRNPRTGAPIEIAASSLPRFRAGAALRGAVAGVTPTRSDVRVAPSVTAPSTVTAPSDAKTSGEKTSGKKAAAAKTSGKRAAATKTSGKKAAAKNTSATKTSGKKAAGKKTSGKRS